VSRSLEIVEDFATSSEGRGPAWDELLRAAERGDECETRALAVRLAHHVLASPAIQLAHEVLAGGPHATAKAIELAESLAGADTPSLACPTAAEARR
jgi:hypothetical protein